jgi:hypothetical protein
MVKRSLCSSAHQGGSVPPTCIAPGVLQKRLLSRGAAVGCRPVGCKTHTSCARFPYRPSRAASPDTTGISGGIRQACRSLSYFIREDCEMGPAVRAQPS